MKRRDLLILSLLLPLAACDRRTGGNAAAVLAPVPIQVGDECAVCGMLVQGQPGPKGEVFLRGAERPAKFCSTTDMFAYLLQPEHNSRVAQAYVHDMGATSWEAPSDDAFVTASDAWFVVGHSLSGGMGHTLASFREKAAAERFAADYGGRVLPFGDVTLTVLRTMNSAPSGHHGGH